MDGFKEGHMDQDDYPEEEVTKKQCLECKGEGFVTVERGTIYRGEPCKFCKGTGRVPMSGEYYAVKPRA